jgi:hypothetical protein
MAGPPIRWSGSKRRPTCCSRAPQAVAAGFYLDALAEAIDPDEANEPASHRSLLTAEWLDRLAKLPLLPPDDAPEEEMIGFQIEAQRYGRLLRRLSQILQRMAAVRTTRA